MVSYRTWRIRGKSTKKKITEDKIEYPKRKLPPKDIKKLLDELEINNNEYEYLWMAMVRNIIYLILTQFK